MKWVRKQRLGLDRKWNLEDENQTPNSYKIISIKKSEVDKSALLVKLLNTVVWRENLEYWSLHDRLTEFEKSCMREPNW